MLHTQGAQRQVTKKMTTIAQHAFLNQDKLVEIYCQETIYDFFLSNLLTYSYAHLRDKKKSTLKHYKNSKKKAKKFKELTKQKYIPVILENYRGSNEGPEVAAMLLYLAENCTDIMQKALLQRKPFIEQPLLETLSNTIKNLFFTPPFHDPTQIHKETLQRIRPIQFTKSYFRCSCYTNAGTYAYLCTLM